MKRRTWWPEEAVGPGECHCRFTLGCGEWTQISQSVEQAVVLGCIVTEGFGLLVLTLTIGAARHSLARVFVAIVGGGDGLLFVVRLKSDADR